MDAVAATYEAPVAGFLQSVVEQPREPGEGDGDCAPIRKIDCNALIGDNDVTYIGAPSFSVVPLLLC